MKARVRLLTACCAFAIMAAAAEQTTKPGVATASDGTAAELIRMLSDMPPDAESYLTISAEEVIARCTRALQHDGSLPRSEQVRLHRARGEAYAAVGDLRAADTDFAAIARLDPANARAKMFRLMLGTFLSKAPPTRAKIDALAKAYGREPLVLNALASWEFREGHHDRALANRGRGDSLHNGRTRFILGTNSVLKNDRLSSSAGESARKGCQEPLSGNTHPLPDCAAGRDRSRSPLRAFQPKRSRRVPPPRLAAKRSVPA